MSVDGAQRPVNEMTTILGSVNTELKCSLLGILSEDAAVTDAQLFEDLHDRNAFALRRPLPQSSHLGDIVQRIPDTVAATSRDTITGKRVHVRKSGDIGRLATGIAGGLMGLSADTSMPIRTVVGERRQASRNGAGHDTATDAVANRLTTYHSALILGKEGRWFRRDRLLTFATLAMGGSEIAVRRVMSKLIEARLLEQRTSRKRVQYRFRPDDGFHDPIEVVRSYVQLAGRFAMADEEAIADGHVRLAALLADEERLPYLIQRSYAATRHTGKHTPRAPRPAHQEDPVTPSSADPFEDLPLPNMSNALQYQN